MHNQGRLSKCREGYTSTNNCGGGTDAASMGSVQATLQLARGGITRDVTSSSKQGAASHLRLVLKRLALLSLGLLLLLLLLLLRRRQRNGDGSNEEGAAGLFVSNTKVAGEVEGGHDVDRLGATATAQVTLLPFRHLVVLCASPVSQRQRRHDLRHHLHEDAAVAAKEMYSCTIQLFAFAYPCHAAWRMLPEH